MSYTTRTGLIFRAGDYQEKQFSLTPDELRVAAATFQPVPVDLEHKKTMLDNHLGELTAVSVSEDGQALFGTVTEPDWLRNLLGDTPRKVSLEWDRATKLIRGLALVLTPHIADAALFAAFSNSMDDTNDADAIDWNEVDFCRAAIGLPTGNRTRMY
jgi:hypothetical protein